MPTFTDGDIFDAQVDDHYTPNGMIRGVWFCVENQDTGGHASVFLSREDLVKMIKMIEGEE